MTKGEASPRLQEGPLSFVEIRLVLNILQDTVHMTYKWIRVRKTTSDSHEDINANKLYPMSLIWKRGLNAILYMGLENLF